MVVLSQSPPSLSLWCMEKNTLDVWIALGSLKRRKARVYLCASRSSFWSSAQSKLFTNPCQRVSIKNVIKLLSSICSCYFDNVAVYEGDFVNPYKRTALVCGNLTGNLPTFKSESNSMVVNFNADSSRHFGGFTAKVQSLLY